MLGPLVVGFVCLIAFVVWGELSSSNTFRVFADRILAEVKAKIPNRVFPMEAFTELRGFAIITYINAALSSLAIGLAILWPQRKSGTSSLDLEQIP